MDVQLLGKVLLGNDFDSICVDGKWESVNQVNCKFKYTTNKRTNIDKFKNTYNMITRKKSKYKEGVGEIQTDIKTVRFPNEGVKHVVAPTGFDF